MSTWPPFAMAGQPRLCAGVGASNMRSNHARVAGLKSSRALMPQGYRANICSHRMTLGDAAFVVLEEEGFWGALSFVDFFSLARIDGNWKIVNKTFAHTGGELPAS